MLRFLAVEQDMNTTLIDPDGGVYTFTYDNDDRNTAMIDPDGNRTTLQYDAVDRVTTQQGWDGLTEALAYDAASQLTTQITLNGGTRIATIVDSYDGVGNRTGRDRDENKTTWDYDVANRLTTQIQSSGDATFAMDAMSNLLVKNQTGSSPLTMNYDAANRLTTAIQGSTVTTFTFDANGNQIAELTGTTIVSNTYDKENRLKLIEQGISGGPLIPTDAFSYDGDGLRRTRGIVGVTTFIWDGTDVIGEVT